jgi:Polysaccharide deacetylase
MNESQGQLAFTFPWSQSISLSVSVMLEGWTDHAAPEAGPMGNPLHSGVLDLQARNWADYGAVCGAHNLLRVFDRHQVQAVFYVSGLIAERNAGLVKSIVQAGHFVAAHSWAQDQMPAYQNPEEQKSTILRCVEMLRETSGTTPLGWMSPRCTPGTDTMRLLGEAGFLWSADIFDADLPYVLDSRTGLIAMPFSVEINDMPLSIRYGNAPSTYSEILRRLLDNWQSTGVPCACLDLTVHSHVFGRPYGLVELAASLQLAHERGESVHLTTHHELARLCQQQMSNR